MSRARRGAALAAAILLSVTTAQVVPTAAAAGTALERAEESFGRFARKWMSKLGEPMKRRSNVQRVSLRAIPGRPSSFRGYEGDFQLDLRPTGVESSPFVGILRYSELTYRCTGDQGPCRVVDRTPVTEIFRLKGGRWIY